MCLKTVNQRGRGLSANVLHSIRKAEGGVLSDGKWTSFNSGSSIANIAPNFFPSSIKAVKDEVWSMKIL